MKISKSDFQKMIAVIVAESLKEVNIKNGIIIEEKNSNKRFNKTGYWLKILFYGNARCQKLERKF